MDKYKIHVAKEIAKRNCWYVGSQFEWAEKEIVKRIFNRRQQFFYKILKERKLKKKIITILDYGCGDGYWTLFFSQFPYCKVVGVDYNSLRLKRARSIVKNVEFIEADLRKRNQHIGKYDIVFCSQVIEHIQEDIKFLMNIKNHLETDGILILGTTNEGSLTHRMYYERKKIKTDHVHFYTEKEIKDKIKRAKFKIKRIFREVFFPGNAKIYYKFTSTNIGFRFLEVLTNLIPSQCSDFYFECIP
ncbi:MAG: class I SAM-dependent methyltransferase [Candidatus Helarchaeota archaeon]